MGILRIVQVIFTVFDRSSLLACPEFVADAIGHPLVHGHPLARLQTIDKQQSKPDRQGGGDQIQPEGLQSHSPEGRGIVQRDDAHDDGEQDQGNGDQLQKVDEDLPERSDEVCGERADTKGNGGQGPSDTQHQTDDDLPVERKRFHRRSVLEIR